MSGRRIVAALQRGGFEVVWVTGSHHMLRRPGSPASKVVVSVHGAKDLPIGTVLAIVKQSGFGLDEFTELP